VAPGGIDHIFALLDINSDGSISAEELRQSFVKFDDPALRMALGLGETEADDIFNSIDTNGDGEISKEELSAYLERNGWDPMSTKWGTMPLVDSLFAALDKNADARLSRDPNLRNR
jgi:Ca2+-binding EF-hand superfamily protein